MGDLRATHRVAPSQVEFNDADRGQPMADPLLLKQRLTTRSLLKQLR